MITKQLKITKLFRKGATKLPEDCEDLQEEIQRLELRLKELQDEKFQLQRNCNRQKVSPIKKKGESFVRPEKLMLTNSVSQLKKDLELMSVLSGIEVQSYVLDDHCCIVYHMQHPVEHEVKHGLRIELKNVTKTLYLPSRFCLPIELKEDCTKDFLVAIVLAVGGFNTENTDNRGCSLVNNDDVATIIFVVVVDVGIGVVYCDNLHNSAATAAFTSQRHSYYLLHRCANEVSQSSLPLGFKLDAVMEDFDNIMLPECLGAIRKALVAYYNRLDQFEALKKLLNMEAELFKLLDGSHIKVSFVAQNDMDEDGEPLDIELMLDYRVYDIRPKQISFKESDLPEGAVDVLRQQCALFKKKPLHKAFRDTFIDGAGPYKFVEQVGIRSEEVPRRNKRFRPTRRAYNNDDTFLPEECSDHSDADAE